MDHPETPSDDARDALGRYGPFAIAVVTISLVSFPIAFNLGAYGVVFYEDVFRFVVAATAGLAVSLLVNPYSGHRRWFTNAALAAPAVWMIVAVLTTDSVPEAINRPVLGVSSLIIAVVSIPTVLSMLIEMFVPGFRSYENTKLLLSGVTVIAAIAVAGFVIGANNDAFLTCDDFKVAGADQPENCAPG